MHYLFVFIFILSNLLNFSGRMGITEEGVPFREVLKKVSSGLPGGPVFFFLEEEEIDNSDKDEEPVWEGDLSSANSPFVNFSFAVVFKPLYLIRKGKVGSAIPLFLLLRNFRL